MSTHAQRCANCRFWGTGTGEDLTPCAPAEAARAEPVGRGHCECRRFPPTVVSQTGHLDDNIGYTLVEHALTESHGWCGEWQAAHPQTVDEAAVVMARAVLAGDATAGRALADKLIELVVLPAPPLEPTGRNR